jgi:regulator of PEP synthase PpsR (kinase-PPPase family)
MLGFLVFFCKCGRFSFAAFYRCNLNFALHDRQFTISIKNPMRDIVSPHLPAAERTVFFVSDGTGITAETFGHSVLTQFELRFRQIRLPFIDTLEKAYDAVRRINESCVADGKRPIVFSTLVKADLSAVVRRSSGMHMDLIHTFVEPLEQELGIKSSHTIGRSHNIADSDEYKNRIEAINFSLAHDDGQSDKNLALADVILVGVSRSGKTPTSLYLAMQHGLKAANYPLVPEDFERRQLPPALAAYRRKIFGLTIQPERLSQIRNERRPNSRYADLENCRYEVAEAEAMMRRSGINWLSSTTKSIEEIATTILRDLRPDRLMY